MPNSYRTSMNINFLLTETQQLHVRKSDDTESFVDLKKVNLILTNTSMLQSLWNCKSWSRSELGWGFGGVTPASDLGKGLQAQ